MPLSSYVQKASFNLQEMTVPPYLGCDKGKKKTQILPCTFGNH